MKMRMKLFRSSVIFAALIFAGCGSDPNSEQDINAIANLLAGEFDSGRHMQVDKFRDLAKEDRHGWVNRTFVPVEATDMDGPILLGSTRYGGDKWIFDDNEFLVWTFKRVEDGIVMTPRRFKDLEARKPRARDMAGPGAFSLSDLEAAKSGAACEIVWTPIDGGFSGQSKPCFVMSTVHKKELNWDWRYNLSHAGMTIAYSGTDTAGTIVEATPKNAPYILNRLEEPAEFHNGKIQLMNPFERADHTKAAKLLKEAVKISPGNASAHLNLAYAYVKQNKYDEAKAALEQAKQLKPGLREDETLWLSALDARIADDFPRDLAAWEAVTAKNPNDRWAWYERASIQYRTEQYADALVSIEQALALQPDEKYWGATYIYYLQSKANFRLGEYQKAITTAEPGVRNPSTRRATFYRKAMAQIAAGELSDPAPALGTYYEYSKRDGKVNEAVYNTNLGLFFHELGDFDKAVTYSEKGYAMSKGAYQSWALAYSLTEKGEAEKALLILDKAIAANPGKGILYAGKGWAFYRQGKLEEAKTQLKTAQSLSERKNGGVERDMKIIKAALAQPAAEQVPPMRWFGD